MSVQDLTNTTSTITVDLASLSGWSSVTSGQHSLTIVAKATGYRDSNPSVGVNFTKAASGYTVTVSGGVLNGGRITFYDGQDTTGTYLFSKYTGGYEEIPFSEPLLVTSGYLCVTVEGFNYTSGGTPSAGITQVSYTSEPVETYVYQVTADGTISGFYAESCFVEGTQITLADGSKKAIEDITYDDELLVWNFYKGEFDSAKPTWIMQPRTTNHYNLVKFSDGSELGLVGSKGYHRIFNKEAGKFTYTGTDETPNGTTTFNENGEFVKVESQQIVEKPVRYYNIITKGHFNLFANGILTSCRLSNKYRIEHMKYAGYPLYNTAEEEAYFGKIEGLKK